MRIAFLAATVLCSGIAAHADPVEGTWQTERLESGGYGHVQIAPCGPAFCGVLMRAFDAGGAEVPAPEPGRRIVLDMVARGDGLYDGGQVWSPDRGRTYAGKLELDGDSLSVFGCVLGLCQLGDTWRRVR